MLDEVRGLRLTRHPHPLESGVTPTPPEFVQHINNTPKSESKELKFLGELYICIGALLLMRLIWSKFQLHQTRVDEVKVSSIDLYLD